MRAPDEHARRAAQERVAALATPAGALGRLADLGVWLAACQGEVPPRPVDDVRLAIFAGDHGVAAHGVSAYPSEITRAMVATFESGRGGVNALARAHGVGVRVIDVAVDDERAGPWRVCRGSRPIHLDDALTPEQHDTAWAVGVAVAEEEIAAGADLLISGDMGIGNTTPSAAMIAATLGLPADLVVGRGTGVDDDGLIRKTAIVAQALARVGDRGNDPRTCLTALGSADLTAATAFQVTAARAGVPVLLDGLMAVTCALLADAIDPGAAAWFAAGHRSTEPAQSLALEKLGLRPLLDLDLRLGEGSGAVAAVPVVRSAVALLRDVALLADLL
ncbi:nicotinate-nucleotide--dimethylbenzimidazole phosphoribosyltransferase [Nocardioides sp. R-C-SC26]|uniref:nicotinate-nucleotide--dimethylbenzimidazole phosphoribosyltransferase n=1 Tax=Nocardioides sp. R-C-SC26 TaxID=2870414 RepID=UPI001E3B24D0|nr:nicotinate-nucleotide--dimethylbenzimidazole phosphoribosyltransferase [Nocardioides sp. R-C-SC26]